LRASLDRVLSGLASLLPGLVALLLSVAAAAAIGAVVRWLLTAVLRALRFDQRLERWGASALAEWSPARSPTLLVGRMVHWTLILLGGLVGLAALDPGLMATMLERLGTYLPNVFVAAVLAVTGTVLARFLARGVLISAVNMQIQSARLMSLGVKWLVLLLTAAMALDHLSIGGGILKLAFGILFGGIVLALALAVGLGSKEVVSRTWERQSGRAGEELDAPLQHL
jgi:mechanosensitive ion channel-like protein